MRSLNFQERSLRAAYARRACYTTLTLSAIAALPAAYAQQVPPPAGDAQTPPPAFKVIPMPPGQGAKDNQGGKRAQGRGQGGQQNGGRKGRGQGRPGTPFNPNMPNGGPPIRTLPGGGLPNAGGGGQTFSFDFRGSDITNVLKFYAQMSGLTISADPGLSGPVTIINPKPVSLDEAFKVLQQVLLVRGFSATQNGSVLSILPFDRAATNTPILNPGLNEEGNTRVDPRNQVMTQVIPLENVDAEELAKELKELTNKGASLIGSPGTNALILTDTASNVERFIRLVDALDKTSNKSELRTYPLRRAEASAVTDIINNLFKQITTRGRGAAPTPGQPGQPNFNPGQPGQQAQAGRPAVVAVADQRTNSVIVVASPDQQEKIANDIINRLDEDDTNTLTTKIRRINFADAATVASLVNSVLSNARGGASSTAPPSFAARAFGFTDPSSQQNVASTDPFGKLVADQRTNSVLITANAERMKQIDDLIDQLDREVPFEPTTFVFPLRNAQAEDVAYALGQAFQTNQNNNNFGGFFGFGFGGNSNLNGNQRQPINRRLQSSTRAAQTRGVPPGPPNAPDSSNQGDGTGGNVNGGSAMPNGVPGVMTDQGFVPTEGAGGNNNGVELDADGKPKTRQFFFGGRQRSLGQVQGPQFGRGRTGTYSNLLQLQNNVFVTPSPGGDSVIVTTTPDNYEAVRQIIEALDVVPRQVMVELIVAEVTLDSSEKLGFNLNGLIKSAFGGQNSIQTQYNGNVTGFNSGTTGLSLDPLASGAQAALTGINYNLLLQALQQDNKVRILSTPRVFTSNNQQADIEITQRVPYITGQQSSGFVNTTVSNTVEFLNVGVTLRVTPRITRQGLVTIDVISEASELLRFQTLGTGVAALTAPVTNDRYTDTSVTIQDGETAAIGGLIRENLGTNINKVPLLGEIPLIGQFFRSREVSRSKVELVIFMTPHVVSTTEDVRQLTRKEGRTVIRQIPELPQQQPNLDLRGFDANGKPLPPKANKNLAPDKNPIPDTGGASPNKETAPTPDSKKS